MAVSARTRAQVEETAAETGGIAIEADVSKREEVERMVATTEAELGPIDVLVSNAGIALWEDKGWELEPEEWWHVLEVNVLGVYLGCRAAIPGMIERGGGRIVNVASGAAYLPGIKSTAYSASKAAVHRFSETLAEQLAPYGIPVFSISPGLVRTELIGSNFARRRAVDAARARAAARPGPRIRPPRRAVGPLPARRARRHRRRRRAAPMRSPSRT